MEITIQEECKKLLWDSKTGLVQGEVNGVIRAIHFIGKSFGTIPVGGIDKNSIYYKTTDEVNRRVLYFTDGTKIVGNLAPIITSPVIKLEYNYWYY